MDTNNIVSVSWGDHLVAGDGDGLLNSVDSLRRRMEVWREELGAGSLHWRQARLHRTDGVFTDAPGTEQSVKLREGLAVEWDDFEVVPRVAHEMGMKAHLYVPVFDEGRPLASEAERKGSYADRGHGQDLAWQSNFTIEHPEYLVVDRSLQKKQWGVLSMAYPEVRELR